MSDLLISFGNAHNGDQLLSLLELPYRGAEPEGRSLDFGWGSIAVLEEPIAGRRNIVEKDGHVLAWVGDLTTEMTDTYVDGLLERLAYLQKAEARVGMSFEEDNIFGQLDGAFAILCAGKEGVCVILDVVGSVPVYAGYGKEDQLRAIGTHQDLVAIFTDEPLRVDLLSATEFLNSVRITFPHTMHEQVKRLHPAQAHWFGFDSSGQVERHDVLYWRPPKELQEYDEDELASELRTCFEEAVQKRCKGNRVAVSLSGGLDSRLVMAAVPKSVECIGITFCDTLNRETKTAAKAAKCYQRSWVPLFRDPEHIGIMAEAAVRFLGCESFFLDTHVIGLIDEISRCRVDCVLSGIKMDTYLRCYYARDIVRVPRLAGLLPPKYVRKSFDFAGEIEGVCRSVLQEACVAGVRKRKEDFIRCYADPDRTSLVEWLTLYPVFSAVEGWPAERRVLSIVSPAFDRKLIEFCFKCPTFLKAGSRIYLKAAKELFGPGRRIPDANNGVRPGSGHWFRLAQRAARKSHDWAARVLEKLGVEPAVEHSWHDYEKYWRRSAKIDELRDKYSTNLDQLDGVLFKKKGRALLENRQIDWGVGFRLLQVAMWLGIMREYKAAVGQRYVDGCIANDDAN